MKIHVQRNSFVPTFLSVATFAAQKDLRPRLQCVKLETTDSGVVLMATDGETGARAEVKFDNPFNVAQEGKVLVPAKLLARIFSETKDDEILLESTGSELLVKGSGYRYNLGLNPEVDEFPDVTAFDAPYSFKIAGAELQKLIRRTIFACESHSAHYQLDGVMFLLGSQSVSAIATDGRRLAIYETSCEIDGELPEDFQEIQAIFTPLSLRRIVEVAKNEPTVLISVSGGIAEVKAGNIVIRSTLRNGRFPDHTNILPNQEKAKANADFIVSTISCAVRQASVVQTDDKPGVTLDFTDNTVYVASRGDSKGSSSVEVPISYAFGPNKFTVDARFLNDFFSVLDPDSIVHYYFEFSDFRTLFVTDDGYRYVVMQISIPS